MAQNVVRVRVEVDYERLAAAIRSAVKDCMSIETEAVEDARLCTDAGSEETDVRDFTVQADRG